CPAPHRNAVRQGPDELLVDAASPRLIDHGATGHGILVNACGPGGGSGTGRPAGDPAPVHAADAQARDFPGVAPDPGASAPVEEADAREELAALTGPDGGVGADGLGPSQAADLLAGPARRPVGPDGAGPGLRYESLDEVQGQG